MLFLGSMLNPAQAVAPESFQIMRGRQAAPLEAFAADELQRYLYHVTRTWIPVVHEDAPLTGPTFLVGHLSTHPVLGRLAEAGSVQATETDPGAEGFHLRSLQHGGQPVLAVAGTDSIGTLYGVYALLEKRFGIRFYLTGDVFPVDTVPLVLPDIDLKCAPRQKIRGFLPWTNFPQSATSYSLDDYRFIFDQMAKMRMNFLHLHNYNGEGWHNEMFHNFTLNGATSRVWFATARSGHAWQGAPWDVNRYLFGARDLFGDYDWGSDAALHNEGLSTLDVFAKGTTLMRQVLNLAHERGVKVGLGVDIDLIPTDYETQSNNPDVVEARVSQIARDYPDLDYYLAFRSERLNVNERSEHWARLFGNIYTTFKREAPRIKLAVSGWGLPPAEVADLPPDVIAAPIAPYTAGWQDGRLYGEREYWACPWLERDFNSSVYYYPYNIHLSDTVAHYQNVSTNTQGLLCLTWRIGDAVEAKMKYIADTPWDKDNVLSSSLAVYRDYAEANYGPEAAEAVLPIINENEPYASNYSECQETPSFGGQPRTADLAKAREQVTTVTQAMESVTVPQWKERLAMLRSRLAAVEAYCQMDEKFNSLAWEQLPGPFEPWARSFVERVNDVSSLGNVVSTQNRFVQLRYLGHVQKLRGEAALQPPSEVEARGTSAGVVLRWKNEESSATGFHVYRDGERITPAPLPVEASDYPDAGGQGSYSVAAVLSDGLESSRSIESKGRGGESDSDPPRIVVVSPPGSLRSGVDLDIRVALLDDRVPEELTATLHWRLLGRNEPPRVQPMVRQGNGVFACRIDEGELADGIEYFVAASDGRNLSAWPTGAPEETRSVVVTQRGASYPREPIVPELYEVDGELRWSTTFGQPALARIYRSRIAEFEPSPDTFLTYVAGTTRRFRDLAPDRDSRALCGTYHYRVTAVDVYGREGETTGPVSITYDPPVWDPLNRTPAHNASDSSLAFAVPNTEHWYARHLNHMSRLAFGPAELPSGTSHLAVRFSSFAPPSGTSFDIRLDNPLIGPQVGSMDIPDTGGWQRWTTRFIPLKGDLRGTHTLFLRASGGWEDLARVSWIQLHEAGDAMTFEAEDGALTHCRVYENPTPSGGKGVGFFGAQVGSAVLFDVPPSRHLAIRYSNENKQETRCTLYADGSRVGKVYFAPTGGWQTYQTVTITNLGLPGPLKLQTDEDDLLKRDGQNQFQVNFDWVQVK